MTVEQTTEQPEGEISIADLVPSNMRAPKMNRMISKKKVKPKAYVAKVSDPVTEKQVTIPSPVLTEASDSKELIKHVNNLTKIVQIQSTLLSEWRKQIEYARKERDIPLELVTKLANSGASQVTIANLLGFNPESFKDRKDLHDAWTVGRAELQLILSDTQIKTALKGNPLLQIFLGKQILGQVDTPPSSVNVTVNTASELRTKIREHRKAAQLEFNSVVEGEILDGPNE